MNKLTKLISSSSSINLAKGAIILWIASLAFTGFSLYHKQEELLGLHILLMGWLSPLILNFAWFANIFFLIGILRLLAGKLTIIPSFLAVLFSFDTFRLSSYLLNEGGGSTQVYGYGWGAILWFLSIFLLLAASEARQSEVNNQKRTKIGFFLFITTIILTLFWSIYDRSIANTSEQQRLSGIAFKRGSVCSVNPSVKLPMDKITGPLEIITDEKNIQSAKYPFLKIESLLNWGIPIVRIYDKDFSLKNGNIISVPAIGFPSALLYINEKRNNNRLKGMQINVKLIETSSNRTVFDQRWNYINPSTYCPNYHSFPSDGMQPRKLVVQALGLSSEDSSQIYMYRSFDPVTTTVGSVTKSKVIDLQYLDTEHASSLGTVSKKTYEPSLHLGQSFLIGDTSYYLGNHGYSDSSLFFDENNVYIYFSRWSNSPNNNLFHIEKRRLSDFEKMWDSNILILSKLLTKDNSKVQLQSVHEINGNLRLEIFNTNLGEIITVNSPLNSSY